jgi:hypothetical protein
MNINNKLNLKLKKIKVYKYKLIDLINQDKLK